MKTPLRPSPKVLLAFQAILEESTTMMRGVAHYMRTHRPWITFIDDEGHADKDPEWIGSRKFDGVISRVTTPALAEYCGKLNVPLVDLNDAPVLPRVPKIRPDNHAIGRLGAEHFIERGFTQFAFCGYSTESWSCERRDGFVATLGAAGRACEVFDVNWPHLITPYVDLEQVSVLQRWLAARPKPVAIMAAHDFRALQVLNAARALGLLVPEEMAVLGADNDQMRCELAHPSLSSVVPDAFRSGYLAAETLDALMRRDVPVASEVRVEPLEVIVRPSSDTMAIGDRTMAAALSWIRQHACSGISVNEVATHVSASRSQLEKKFRRYIGRSPQGEIRRIQIAKIKQLLAETDLPLKSIAELTGFEHLEYLSVVFKRVTRETPGAFRAAARSRNAVDNISQKRSNAAHTQARGFAVV